MIYIFKKLKGAYVRSRARWIEKGEKSNNYFCRLEKNRQENNSINSLYVNGDINTSPKIISSEIFQFYSSLHSSSFSESDCNIFFNNIHSSIPQLEQGTKDLCEADIKIEEVDKAINKLCSGKSPGFFECIQDNSLSSTMKQGLITLISKPGKDARHIDNLRPISLLNCDYKILAHIFSDRLKNKLNQVISESQSGFLKGRSIHNNIRLILDILDYHEWIEDDR